MTYVRPPIWGWLRRQMSRWPRPPVQLGGLHDSNKVWMSLAYYNLLFSIGNTSVTINTMLKSENQGCLIFIHQKPIDHDLMTTK